MTAQFVEAVAFDTFRLILTVSAPVLFIAMGVGLTMSILQATTQINEMTLAFIPKIISIYITLIIFSGYMISRLVNFAEGIFSDFTRFIG